MLSFFPRGVLDEILNLTESVSEDFPSYSLVSKYNFGSKTLLLQGLSEPEFNGESVYKFRKIIGKYDFPYHFKKIVIRCKKIGYNVDVLRQTACLVANSIKVNNFAHLFDFIMEPVLLRSKFKNFFREQILFRSKFFPLKREKANPNLQNIRMLQKRVNNDTNTSFCLIHYTSPPLKEKKDF